MRWWIWLLAGLMPVSGASAAPTVVCRGAGHDRWLPYSYELPDRTMAGAAHDILEQALAMVGLRYERRLVGPWKRVIASLETGAIDIVAGAFPTAAREERFLFSTPLSEVPIHIFARTDRQPTFERWEDLRGKRMVTSLGNSFGDAWDRFARENLEIVWTSSVVEGVRMLRAGRVDFAVSPLDAGRLAVRAAGLEGLLVPLPRPLTVVSLSAVFAPGSPCADRLPDINRAVERLRADGEIERILDRHREIRS
ncbi:MAG TPA: transporter substrate-binding domain-containing protein [Azospirillaceae bacterium]|nr:transporter substrate-binding domain-containing protein [Azospirillaceae bacterium]